MILLWIWSDYLLYILSAVYVVIVAVSIPVFMSWAITKKDEKIKDRENKYNLLISGILSNTITNAYSFEVVYKGLKTSDFDAFVQDFLNYALEKLDGTEYRMIEEFIKRMEEEKAKNDPFDGCLPPDKQYLLSIQEVVSNSRNEAAKHALQEVSRSIKEKDGQLHVQKTITIVTIILTGVGLALNLVFGIRGLSDKDVKRIKNVTTEVVASNPNDSIMLRNDSIMINNIKSFNDKKR